MVDRETAVEQEVGALVRRQASRYMAPAGLADRIADSLQAAARPQRTVPAWGNWRSFAMAASLLLAVGLSSGVTWFFAASDRQADLAQQVVAGHVRSMLGGDHLIDVASSDQHTVKPWFGGKLDLSPPVVDLTGQGFPLVGGRLDYLDRRPVAALVYRHSQHVINLFIWPEKAALPVAAPAAMQGYNLRHWREGDLTFWAVSDVNPADLESFAQIFQVATR